MQIFNYKKNTMPSMLLCSFGRAGCIIIWLIQHIMSKDLTPWIVQPLAGRKEPGRSWEWGNKEAVWEWFHWITFLIRNIQKYTFCCMFVKLCIVFYVYYVKVMGHKNRVGGCLLIFPWLSVCVSSTGMCLVA